VPRHTQRSGGRIIGANIRAQQAESGSGLGDGKRLVSLKHLVGADHQLSRNGQSHPRGDLFVDNEIELCWLHHRQIAETFAFQYPASVHSDLSKRVGIIGPLSHQATCQYHLSIRVHGRDGVSQR
jgi:hypothetical protein